MARIELENWGTLGPDARVLMALHVKELAVDPRMPLDIDDEQALALERAGALKCLSARGDNGLLLGYCIWYLVPSIESRGLMVAQQGPWFVKPEARDGRVGLALLTRSLEILKVLGAKNAFLHYWTAGDHRLGQVFERLGAHEVERVYSLWIGEGEALRKGA